MTNHIIDTSKLIQAYIEYCENHDQKNEWAMDLFDHNMIYDTPYQAWPILLELIRLAKNKTQLYLIAAGPLENIVNYHGANFIERIEEEARKNPRFSWTILGVWPNKKDKVVFERFTSLQEKYKNHEIDLPEK